MFMLAFILIFRWIKQKGDFVKEDELVAEIETDKVLFIRFYFIGFKNFRQLTTCYKRRLS